MNFKFSEEQELIAASAYEFAEQYIRPHIMEWDEAQYFPKDILQKAGEMGFMGIFIPEEYGGSGLEIGRAHVRTPVTSLSRMPSSA